MTSNVNVNQVVGDTFEDLSISEMVQVQGSGDVVPEFSTSPVCAVSVVTARVSSAKCASAASGVVISVLKC